MLLVRQHIDWMVHQQDQLLYMHNSALITVRHLAATTGPSQLSAPTRHCTRSLSAVSSFCQIWTDFDCQVNFTSEWEVS